jgi:hypothetical protein
MTETVTCPKCKAQVRADLQYCDQCSVPLNARPPTPGAAVAPARGPATASQALGPATVSQAPDPPAAGMTTASTPLAPPAAPVTASMPPPAVPAARPITTTLDRPPARRGSQRALIIGLVLVGGLFLAAVSQAALLLTNRAVATPLPQAGLDPTAAAVLIEKQATALAIQQTTTAQFQAQATRLAEQPLAFQATLTAVSVSGTGVPLPATSTVTPTLTLSPAPAP